MAFSALLVATLATVTTQKLKAQGSLNCYSACYINPDFDCVINYPGGYSNYCEFRGPFPN